MRTCVTAVPVATDQQRDACGAVLFLELRQHHVAQRILHDVTRFREWPST